MPTAYKRESLQEREQDKQLPTQPNSLFPHRVHVLWHSTPFPITLRLIHGCNSAATRRRHLPPCTYSIGEHAWIVMTPLAPWTYSTWGEGGPSPTRSLRGEGGPSTTGWVRGEEGPSPNRSLREEEGPSPSRSLRGAKGPSPTGSLKGERGPSPKASLDRVTLPRPPLAARRSCR